MKFNIFRKLSSDYLRKISETISTEEKLELLRKYRLFLLNFTAK